MRYKAGKINDTQYAVFANNKQYFDDTTCLDLEVAQRRAIEISAQWYQRKIEECEAEWNKFGSNDYDFRDVLA